MPASDPATDSDAPQHARTAKRKPDDIPKPKKRSALYRWWNGNHEEMDYQAAVAAAAAAARAQTAAGASLLELISGRALTYGTGRYVVPPGWVRQPPPERASVAGLLVGMMPGRLNDGEQDFIDRMRPEQMREAPSRVRYTWRTTAGEPGSVWLAHTTRPGQCSRQKNGVRQQRAGVHVHHRGRTAHHHCVDA